VLYSYQLISFGEDESSEILRNHLEIEPGSPSFAEIGSTPRLSCPTKSKRRFQYHWVPFTTLDIALVAAGTLVGGWHLSLGLLL
jgi:hypothetical protein